MKPICLIIAVISIASPAKSMLMGSEVPVEHLLVGAFGRLPADVQFLAQLRFRDERRFDLVLTPASQDGHRRSWMVTASSEGGKEEYTVTGVSSKATVPTNAFRSAVEALSGEGLLRFPCRISLGHDSSGYLVQFADLPLTPGGWISGSVDRSGQHPRVIRGN